MVTQNRTVGTHAAARRARPSPGERGSVLVLVVGVLALMAIIVLVYSTIGMADRRSSAALVERTTTREQESAVRDFIAQVIGDAGVQVVSNRVPNADGSGFIDRVMRKTWVYPGVEWSVQSIPDPDQPWRKFHPEGGIKHLWQNGLLDPRAGYDPYLASIEPAYLRAGLDSLDGVTSPYTGSGSGDRDAYVYHQQFRDLKSISILSPDGRRVNLASIRGNFDAESGFGADGQGRFRTSANLFLLDWADQPTMEMSWLNNLPADPNVPHNWATNLIGHHRMVNQPINAAAVDQLPGGLFHMGNYMADADGDGFYDAAWQELVDVSGVGPRADGTIGTPQAVVPQYGKMRWFIAPKVIDLSGLANMNTGASFRRAPTDEFFPGATPADLDIERLLTMRDIARLGSATGQEIIFSSPLYPNPTGGADPASDYANLDTPNGALREDLGRSAFVSLVTSRIYGAPDNMQRFGPADLIGGVNWMPSGYMDAEARARGYREYSRNQRAAVAIDQYTRSHSSGFTLDSELELRTYNNVNDPGTLSQLEMVLDGRASNRRIAAFGPMRSNRGEAYERLTYSDVLDADLAASLHGTSIRSSITTISGARPLASDPTGHTRVADVTPDPAVNNAFMVRPRAITAAEVRPDAGDTLETMLAGVVNGTGIDAQAHALFEIYADALLAEGGLYGSVGADREAWSTELRNQVQNYGHRIDPATMTGSPQRLGGNSAEVALRTAAAAATNLFAERLYDRPGLRLAADEIVQANLIINNDRRSDLTNAGGNGALAFWGEQTNDPHQPRAVLNLDLDRDLNPANTGPAARQSRLATDQVQGLDAAAGLQLYGVRPQPFLTQAAYFVMYSNAAYTGARAGNSRDAEWTETPPGSGTFVPGPATIWAPVQTSNDDFLMEVFAVQLTNPFDRTIALSAVDPATGNPVIGALGGGNAAQEFRYYVEYAGRFFKLIDGGDTGLLTDGVVLRPGESRVFYCTTQPLATIAARWSASNPSGAAGGFTVDDVRQWIEFQLSTRIPSGSALLPVRMVEFDRSTGRATTAGVNIFSAADNASQRVVRLWRQIRSQDEVTADANSDVSNDYLVDRLRDDPTATRPTLNVQLPPRAAAYAISGTSVMPPDGTPAGDDAYNETRYSITFYGSIRRSDDPSTASGGKQPEGVFPALAIESKATADGFIRRWYNQREVITARSAELPTSSPAEWWFTGTEATAQGFGARRLDGATGLIERQSTSPPPAAAGGVPQRVLLQSLAQEAMERHDTTKKIARSMAWPELVNAPEFDEVYVPIRAMPRARALRPMDLLGPLAVCASFDAQKFLAAGGQVNSATQPPERAVDEAWITLSEALALATNYASTLPPNQIVAGGFNPGLAFYHRFGDPRHGVVNRGQLVLDRFTPFNDTNGNGLFDQSGGAGTLNANGVNSQYVDPARGMGIPMAWQILNNARVGGLGSTTSMIAGLVNINTAPLSVLRLLPMLSPDYERDEAASTDSNVWFADAVYQAQGGRSLFLPDQEYWDLAAVIKAYRDKSAGYTRPLFNTSTLVGASFDFTDNTEGTHNQTRFPFAMADIKGRRLLTGFGRSAVSPADHVNQPIREELGFRSPVELLGVRQSADFRYAGPTQALMTPPGPARADNSIDRLARRFELEQPPSGGRQRVLDAQVGTASVGLAPSWVGDEDPGNLNGALINLRVAEVPESQESRLAILDAVMNSVTTRSDVFCVWFVLHGYTRADTEGLDYYGSPTSFAYTPDDEVFAKPMTPSVSRRFVMVVDRSNVIAAGQKPRILLFQELPR